MSGVPELALAASPLLAPLLVAAVLVSVAAGGGGDARPVRGSNVGGGRSHGDGAFRAVRFVRCVYDMPVQSANGTPQNSAPLIALDQYLLPREARSTNPVGALSSL